MVTEIVEAPQKLDRQGAALSPTKRMGDASELTVTPSLRGTLTVLKAVGTGPTPLQEAGLVQSQVAGRKLDRVVDNM